MKWQIHQDRNFELPNIDSYTITQKKDKAGWKTGSGCEGYGLPKELAQWICDRLNESNEICPYYMSEYGDWKKKSELERKKDEIPF